MSAYGDNPDVHWIEDGLFVCVASPEAKCRTYPTCECEYWCCCDSPDENHDDGEHCCMTTTKPGQECWIGTWIDAVGCEDSCADENLTTGIWDSPDGGIAWPDGQVTCEWDDGIMWEYAQ
jgi:hypothetical protein